MSLSGSPYCFRNSRNTVSKVSLAVIDWPDLTFCCASNPSHHHPEAWS
jgi:hypothetical protein